MITSAASATNGGGIAAGIVIGLVALIAYWVPTIVATIRRGEIPNVGSIVVINLFAGWTIVGWIIALAMACRSRPQQPQYVVPPGWAPQGPGPAGWTPPEAGPAGWTPPPAQ